MGQPDSDPEHTVLNTSAELLKAICFRNAFRKKKPVHHLQRGLIDLNCTLSLLSFGSFMATQIDRDAQKRKVSDTEYRQQPSSRSEEEKRAIDKEAFY